MATPWRDHPAWHVIDDAEAALGEKVGFLVTDATADDLARTREAQLAVLLTSLVVWEAMQPLPEVPVAFAGHSLGQVTALIAAGVLPLEVGVRFAARRAELTQAAADRHPGRMAALLGATPEQAEAACAAAPDACWIANDNAPGQIVIAGTPDGVDTASARAKEVGVKRATPLKVGGAFHTPADARRDRGPRTRARDAGLRRADGADRLQRRRRCPLRRRRLAHPPRGSRLGARALAPDDGHARRRWAPTRSWKSGTGRCSRRSPSAACPTSPSATSQSQKTWSNRSWRSGNSWKKCSPMVRVSEFPSG